MVPKPSRVLQAFSTKAMPAHEMTTKRANLGEIPQWRAMPRRQIKGRQIVLLVRQFFEVKEDRRIQYEVTNLLDVTYSGDARMSQFKYSWDNMVRNLRCNILVRESKTLEHIFYKLLKNSDALRPYLQYYDRLRGDHPDRTYKFLSDMVDKAIREERDTARIRRH